MEPEAPKSRSSPTSQKWSSRWDFLVRAKTIRHAARLGSFLKDTVTPTPKPFKTIRLDSTLSRKKGQNKIKVQVWAPTKTSPTARAAVINFHGGGWILGRGTDDAPWVGALVELLDVIVFTVEYRLAPKHPFPVPIEDCVDAICQITARAAEFAIDPTKIMLSGFSAGASNCLGAWVVLQDPCRWGYTLTSPTRLIGLVLFYPLPDWTVSRAEKRRTSARPDLTLSKRLTHLFDASYVYPSMPQEKSDPRLSPGLMSEELLQQLPPVHLCLCEHDMLLSEGLAFSIKLQSRKKQCTLRLVRGEKHGWDKALRLFPKDNIQVEYQEAIRAMEPWLNWNNQNYQFTLNLNGNPKTTA